MCLTGTKRAGSVVRLADFVPWLEHLYREEKYAARYEINMLRCIFCGLCEEACPKDAIYLSETFAPANFTRKGFIYGKPDLLIPDPKNEPGDLSLAKGQIEDRKEKVRKDVTA